MNKRFLTSYLKKNGRNILKTNCFKYDNNNYLISDSFSIIYLNNAYNLDVKNDTLGLAKLYDNFKWNFSFNHEFECVLDKDCINIDDEFGVNVVLFKSIKNVINANKFEILKNKNELSYLKYIIKLENTKTGEHAFMLPCKHY